MNLPLTGSQIPTPPPQITSIPQIPSTATLPQIPVTSIPQIPSTATLPQIPSTSIPQIPVTGIRPQVQTGGQYYYAQNPIQGVPMGQPQVAAVPQTTTTTSQITTVPTETQTKTTTATTQGTPAAAGWTIETWILIILIVLFLLFIAYFIYTAIADNALRSSSTSLKNMENQLIQTAKNIDKAIPSITQAANDINKIANTIDNNVVPKLDTLINDAENKLLPQLETMASDVSTAATAVSNATKVITDFQTSLCATGLFSLGPPFCPSNNTLPGAVAQSGLSAADLLNLNRIYSATANNCNSGCNNSGFTL